MGDLNSAPERKQPAAGKRRRDPCVQGDGDGRQRLNTRQQKTPTVETSSKKASDTGMSLVSHIPNKNGAAEPCGCSISGPGIVHNIRSQSAVDVATNSSAPQSTHHISAANEKDQHSLELSCTAPGLCKHSVADGGRVSTPCKHTKCYKDDGCISSDRISAKAAPSLQFFVMSEEGINLFVDLNSTPSAWVNSFKEEVCIHPNSDNCEPGNFSNFISSLVSKDDCNTISPSGNITVDIQSKGAESITPCTNSSLSLAVGENSRSEPVPMDATVVSSRLSASSLSGTLAQTSGSQEGVPVASSSCLTSNVPDNKESDRMPGSLDYKGLPQDSIDASRRTERSSASLADASVQPPCNTDTVSPGKTKISENIGCTSMDISDADTDKVAVCSSGDAVGSESEDNSIPASREVENLNALDGAKLNNNNGMHGVLVENGPVEAVPKEEDVGCGDRLSVSCQPDGQTAAKLLFTDAQSDATSSGHCVGGNYDLRNPMSSSAALDNAIIPLTANHNTESARCHDSAGKNRRSGPDAPEELQSKSEPARNILLSLRSAKASAKAAEPSPVTLPRRSTRLVLK